MITKEQLVKMIRDFTADQRDDAANLGFLELNDAVDLLDSVRSEFRVDSSEMRLLMFYADVFGSELHDRCGGLSNSYQQPGDDT